MSNAHINKLLRAWEENLRAREIEQTAKIPISKGDSVRIDALAETYKLSREQVIAHLLHNALKQVEECIPYVQGNKVIRIEEGDPLYEDIGKMPEYLKVKRRLERH